MKNIITILTLITIFSVSWAQNNYRIYVDSTTKKIYYNKKLPVYFWISDKPDNTGHDILLKPVVKKFANPYYFDTEGINTFRIRAPRGPFDEAIFEIWADDRPPMMKYHIQANLSFQKNRITYLGKDAKIILSGVDGISRLADIYYSFNNQEFKYYKGPIDINISGKIVLKFYGCDIVGNCSDTITHIFYTDIEPPIVYTKILGTYSDSILGRTSKISFKAIDSLTGVKGVYFSMKKKGPFTLYKYPILVSQQKEGKYKIYYYAKDNVGNKTEIKTLQYIIDRTPPTVDYKIIGNYFQRSDIFYLSPNAKIQLTAKDDHKVHKINFYVNGRKYDYRGLIDMSSFNGLRTIFYDATDVAGNKSTTKNIRVFIDNTPPKTNILISSPKFINRDTIFITSNTKLSFKAVDKYSGVKFTEIAINDFNFQKYTGPIMIEKEGLYLIHYRSEDELGNLEEVKTTKVFVDNTPPEIKVIFSVEPFDTKIVNNDTIPVFPSNVKIYLGAVDEKTGEEATYYSLNSGYFTRYNTPIRLNIRKNEQIFHLRVKSQDKLGNQTQKEVTFIIRKK